MARQIESDLYQALIDSEFSFVERGVKYIDEIYRGVQKQYQTLCDDSYYCSENCRSGNDPLEWNQAVRRALQRLKSKTGSIVYGVEGAERWVLPSLCYNTGKRRARYEP